MSFKNDQPFEHTSTHGTNFRGSRCDFQGGVMVQKPSWPITELQFAADFGEFIGWHRNAIWEQLNGFAGYDCVCYVELDPQTDEDEEGA